MWGLRDTSSWPTELLIFGQTLPSPPSHPSRRQLPPSSSSGQTPWGVPGFCLSTRVATNIVQLTRVEKRGGGWDHQGRAGQGWGRVRDGGWRDQAPCSPEPGLVPGQAQDAVAVGSVEVVLVGDALRQHLRVHHTPARLRAAPEQRLQGPERSGESAPSPTPPAPPPGGRPTRHTCVSTTEALLGPRGLLMGMV